jgi:hypothetical protein
MKRRMLVALVMGAIGGLAAAWVIEATRTDKRAKSGEPPQTINWRDDVPLTPDEQERIRRVWTTSRYGAEAAPTAGANGNSNIIWGTSPW